MGRKAIVEGVGEQVVLGMGFRESREWPETGGGQRRGRCPQGGHSTSGYQVSQGPKARVIQVIRCNSQELLQAA